VQTAVTVPGLSTLRVVVPCSAAGPNRAVIGGGYSQGGDNVKVYGSYPRVFDESWVLDLNNPGPGGATVDAYAICAILN
jgi:hypothetical protein